MAEQLTSDERPVTRWSVRSATRSATTILDARVERGRPAPTPSRSAPTSLDASVAGDGHRRVPASRRPRLLATIDAVETGLTDDRGLLYRYRGDDGLERRRGHVPALHLLAGPRARPDRSGRAIARACSTDAAGYATTLGLLAEQVDPATGELLGNFPQAFSHLGLVNAAQALADAEAAASKSVPAICRHKGGSGQPAPRRPQCPTSTA